MWDEEDEEDILFPGSDKQEELFERFELTRTGETHYFSSDELEYLFQRYLYTDDEEFTNVNRILEMGLNMFPLTGIFQLCKAQFMIEQSNYGEALELLEQAKLYDPGNPDVYIFQSDCYWEMSQTNKAIEVLLECERVYNEPLDYKLACLYFSQGDKSSGAQRLGKCLKEFCEDNDPHSYSETTYPISFELEELEAAIDLLIEENPFSVSWWKLKAENYTLHLEFSQAFQAFEYAHYLDEKDPEIVFKMGESLKESDSFFTAKDYYLKAAEMGYPKDDCLLQIAVCYNRAKEYSLARFMLQQIEFSDEKSEALYEMGYSFLHDGMPEKALAFLLKCMKLDKGLKPVLIVSETYFLLDKSDEAYALMKEHEGMFSYDYTFWATFFGIFYRWGMDEVLYEIHEKAAEYFDKAEDSILVIFKYVLLKTEGKTEQANMVLMSVFVSDYDLAIELIETIDMNLLTEPEIISMRDLF
jgi:tetratricopeptide (TPR) repeat protein